MGPNGWNREYYWRWCKKTRKGRVIFLRFFSQTPRWKAREQSVPNPMRKTGRFSIAEKMQSSKGKGVGYFGHPAVQKIRP
jgi:hypothetical protein